MPKKTGGVSRVIEHKLDDPSLYGLDMLIGFVNAPKASNGYVSPPR